MYFSFASQFCENLNIVCTLYVCTNRKMIKGSTACHLKLRINSFVGVNINSGLSQWNYNQFPAAEATSFFYWLSITAVIENHKGHLAIHVLWHERTLIYISQGDPEFSIDQFGEQLMCINCICNRFGHSVSGLVTVMNIWVLMCGWSITDSFCLLERSLPII